MALYEGGDRTRTGPYWRRQMHTTLPGERTAQQLAAINAQRAQLGLPPLGGPTQHTAIVGPPQLMSPPAMHQAGAPVGGPGGLPLSPAQPRQQATGGLEQLQLPQLLALRAMLAKAQGQPQVAPAPRLRGVLPQLHRAVPVRSHVRIVQPRPDPYPGY